MGFDGKGTTRMLTECGKLPLLTKQQEQAIFQQFDAFNDMLKAQQKQVNEIKKALKDSSKATNTKKKLFAKYKTLLVSIALYLAEIKKANLKQYVEYAKQGLINAIKKFTYKDGQKFDKVAKFYIAWEIMAQAKFTTEELDKYYPYIMKELFVAGFNF